jgi:hypothetical protein
MARKAGTAARPKRAVPAGFDFNPDPAWQEFIQTYEPIIARIATKATSADEELRKDAMQEARIALAVQRPERVRGWADYQAGTLPKDAWEGRLDRFLRNVIRNSIYSLVDSPTRGNWYVGRNRPVKTADGKVRRVHQPARMSSLEQLTGFGAQIDTHGKISWPDPSDDGLVRHLPGED